MEKISEMQLKVLKVLGEYYDDDNNNCLYIRTIAKEAKLEFRQARLAVRALARKGLAEYVRGLMDEDGMLADSGYCCTREGALIVNQCKHKCGRLISMVTDECEQCWDARWVFEFTADWGDYKKGDKIKRDAIGDGAIFHDLYWVTVEKSFTDKK